jgi:hypothetical protein
MNEQVVVSGLSVITKGPLSSFVAPPSTSFLLHRLHHRFCFVRHSPPTFIDNTQLFSAQGIYHLGLLFPPFAL